MTNLTHSHFDLENPSHFINLLTPELREKVLSIPTQFFDYDEKNLIAKVYGGSPSHTDILLRMNFWEEYEHCFQKEKQMRIVKIYSGVCSKENFLFTSRNPGRLAFIIREPIRVRNKIKLGYEYAIDEMIRILQEPELINSRTGLPDAQLRSSKLRAFEYLDQRLHGSLIQRHQVEQKTLQVNVDGGTTQEPQQLFMTPEEAAKRIAELQNELATIPNLLPSPPEPHTIIVEQVRDEAGRVSEEYKK